MALLFVFCLCSEKHWRFPAHCQKQTGTQNKSRLQLLKGSQHLKITILVILVSNRTTTDKVDYIDFPQLSSLGELALKAGIDPSSTLGYSRERWNFWIQRLEELQKSEIESIRIQARGCLEQMREPAEDTALLL
ncbi:unnamed protein product [Clonostachys rosea]|uniref:Uncharacterized protein n=1 Tax=Bionectria ochroleuca TaxID=29856 RepID=A0ABY6V1M9_BIOOC|nr:unnamed protein product [Clonostachys rosea]